MLLCVGAALGCPLRIAVTVLPNLVAINIDFRDRQNSVPNQILNRSDVLLQNVAA